MEPDRWERWGAATGFLALALGVAGASFERGAPTAGAPAEEVAAYFVQSAPNCWSRAC